ncbi:MULTISPECIES: MFS transporter [unclassified Microbacterium]|uniref:MFS transporter n=1 Tax=unclassified Microbacterium TaxID=2609290 RepID=UPI00137E550B|nr:MFS transporter [Microbacterium sp. MAH-37]
MTEADTRPTQRIGLGTAVSSLRGNRSFQLLWTSNLFFFGGVWTQTLVLGWMAFEMTGSEFLVALFTTVRLAPLLLGPIAGALTDRFDKVRLLLAACGWATTAIAVVSFLASSGMLSYWVLVAGGLAIGLAQSPSQTARASLALELVGPANLSNANALNSLAMNMTQVVGPAIGGAMIAGLGAPAALWVSTAWYAISFALLIPLRSIPHVAHAEPEPVLRMLVSGVRLIGRNRLAVGVLMVTVVANTFLWPVYQSFMPVFADQRFGLDADGLGIMLSCSGIGGLIGSMVIAALGDFRRKGALFVFGTMVWGALWAVFAMLTSPPAGFVVLALAGFASAAFGVLQTTLLLIVTDKSLHGRVLGLQELAIGMIPIGSLLLGVLAQTFGVAPVTFWAAVLLVLSVGGVALRVPAVLRIR